MSGADRKLQLGILVMANCAIIVGLTLFHVTSSPLTARLTGGASVIITLMAVRAFRKRYPAREI